VDAAKVGSTIAGMKMRAGMVGTVCHVVADGDTAIEVGSGDVPVLATPRLIAWAEEACVAAVRGTLAPDETTVGTDVKVTHTRAVPVGERLTVEARLTMVHGNRLRFAIEASHDGVEVGEGTIERALVDRELFLRRATGSR